MKAFISYSRQDRVLKDKFRHHLKSIEGKFSLSVFDDGVILPGEEWEKRIWEEFNKSNIIFFLISSYFINSDFCLNLEFKKAIEKHRQGKAIVIPIILSPCGWKNIPCLDKIQVLPDNGHPVRSKKFESQDMAFSNVINGINKTLTALNWKKINPRKTKKPPKPQIDNYIKTKYKAVFFDLDGTLIRGQPSIKPRTGFKGQIGYEHFRYSWQLVWEHLGFDDCIRKQYYRQYLNKEIGYQEWCDISNILFRDKGLTKSHFKELSKNVRLTKNCKETLSILKQRGVILSVVSGGIDTFLESVFPDYFDYFNYVFINKFHFDERGILQSIETTPYDFDGKYDAITHICKLHNIKPTECVFVGEGRNDKYAANKLMNEGGLSIGYPSYAISDYVDVELDKDRLDAILDVLFDKVSIQTKINFTNEKEDSDGK